METVKDIILILLAGVTFYYGFRYRKKDFQVAILKEQITAYNSLLKILFHNAKRINELYDETINLDAAIDANYMANIPSLQTYLYNEKFSRENSEHFVQFQSLTFLFPEDVIDATMGYFNYLHQLFTEENDLELPSKLQKELNQKVYEVVNAIRNHVAVDDLTIETKRMISKRPQLRFIKEAS